MSPAPRQQLADELLRRFAAALRSTQLYSPGHPIIGRNLEALSTAIQLLHALEPAIVVGIVGDEVVEKRVESRAADMAAIRRLYNESVKAAETIWDSAKTENKPDAPVARTMIDGLAQAVAQNRTALLALTTLKNYDNYTFTHMVNVSILTMGQARGLGMDGALLREFGLAALMHDIGKVRTPIDILNKAEKLTDAE